ncbi:MAG: hypothetical protein BBJ60_09810 [Desulfobacterales bacterium S7086C20]|nr:MAG: hypothetical protein BBJ60_09810 [Desulfobacterales bacterium S7086C20]
MGNGEITMDNRDKCLSLSSMHRRLLRAYADQFCAAFFVQTLEGFVHNLNGPLQILWLRSEQVEKEIAKLQTLPRTIGDESLGLVDRLGQRIDSFLKAFGQLDKSLNFLKQDVLKRRRSEVGRVRINEVVEDVVFLLKADMFFKHNVQVSLELGEKLPDVSGRYSDLCVIVLSVIQNALESMVDSDIRELAVETVEENDKVLIKVQDSGCSISQEDASRMFEPFFTTKKQIEYNGKPQEHRGLGLVLVSVLLEDCRGEIMYESLSGRTMFTVQLPIYSG